MTDTQHIVEIHNQWLASVMSHEPNGSFDHLLQRLPRIVDLDQDPIVHFKLFMPGTGWTWYVLAGRPTAGGDWILHCYATSPYDAELGDVSLNELLGTPGPFGSSVERDRYFTPVPVSKIRS